MIKQSIAKPRTDVTFSYNDDGLRTQAVDAIGTTTYSYDAGHRLTGVTYPGSKTFSYEYDNVGSRTKLTDADNGVTTYVYDADNRLTDIYNPQNERTTFSYDNGGRRTRVTFANTAYTSYTFRCPGKGNAPKRNNEL